MSDDHAKATVERFKPALEKAIGPGHTILHVYWVLDAAPGRPEASYAWVLTARRTRPKSVAFYMMSDGTISLDVRGAKFLSATEQLKTRIEEMRDAAEHEKRVRQQWYDAVRTRLYDNICTKCSESYDLPKPEGMP